jgi:nitrogen fixation-related uncharacterized protein
MVKDKYIVGIPICLLLPFIGFIGFYQWKFSFIPVRAFLVLLGQEKSVLSAMISVSLILNGAALTFFFNKQKDKVAKGIFFTTIAYAIVAMSVKWFL